MNKRTGKNGILSVTLIAILFATTAIQVSAKTPYEFSVHAGGGYSFFKHGQLPNSTYSTGSVGVDYDPPLRGLYAVNGASSSGSAGELGIGFTGFVNPYVGLHVGLGISLHNVNVKVDSLKTLTTGRIDDQNLENDLYTKLTDYKEKHQTFSLSIPFMLQFQTIENASSWRSRPDFQHGFYAKAGFKLNILLSNTYESEVATLYNAAYFPDLDNWADTQTFAGLGSFKGKNAKGDFGFVQAMFACEMGMKWRVGNDMFVYTGAYLDYGLNNPSKNNRQPTSNYLYQDDLRDLALLEYSEKAHLMAIGVKISLAFIR
jgi:hypothetical protein